MKITILGPSYPYRGGIAMFDDRLAEELVSEGHRVETVTFTLQYPSFLFPGKTQYSSAPGPENLKITRALNSVNPFNWLETGRKIAASRPDLLIVAFWLPFMAPSLGTVCRMVRRNGHTRVIGIMHNLIPHEHRIGDRQFCRYFVRSLDGAVALSGSVSRQLDEYGDSLPHLFSPHPLYDNFGAGIPRDEACARLGLSPDSRYLLFFGLIRDYKGLDILLDAFADSRLRGRGLKLIVAGEFYGDGTKYHSQAESLGIDGDIVWHTGYVPDGEVRDFFSAADVVVQPYRSATQSGVTQIAYHFGRPMIVSDVGGLPEIVPDGKVGYVVAPSPEAVAGAIADFYDGGDTERFAAGLAEEKRKYSWKAMCSAIMELFGRLKVL